MPYGGRGWATHAVCRGYLSWGSLTGSWLGFGEEETISRNRETINNPAITAPINITASDLQLCCCGWTVFHEHAPYHPENPRLVYIDEVQVQKDSVCA